MLSRVLLIFSSSLLLLTTAHAQYTYRPNEAVKNKYENYFGEGTSYNWRIGALKNIDDKKLDKIGAFLNKCIEKDSNYARYYFSKSNLRYIQGDFLGEDGVIHNINMGLKKINMYPTPDFEIPGGTNFYTYLRMSDTPMKARIDSIKKYRLTCFVEGLDLNVAWIGSSDSATIHRLGSYFDEIDRDLVSTMQTVKKDRAIGLGEKVYRFYSHEVDFRKNNGEYATASVSLDKMLNFWKVERDERLWTNYQSIYLPKIQIKLYELAGALENYEVAMMALVAYFKVDRGRYYDDSYKNFYSSPDFYTYRNELIRLINLVYSVDEDNSVCLVAGKEKYCDNTMIDVVNYSSAAQFMDYYNTDNVLLQLMTGSNDLMNSPEKVYKFYKETGQSLGMKWPNYKPISLSKTWFGFDGREIEDLGVRNCMSPAIYDVKFSGSSMFVYVKSMKTSENATAIFTVNNPYNICSFQSMPVTLYKSDGTFLKTLQTSCPTAKNACLSTTSSNSIGSEFVGDVFSKDELEAPVPVKSAPQVVNSPISMSESSMQSTSSNAKSVPPPPAASKTSPSPKQSSTSTDGANFIFNLLAYSVKLSEQKAKEDLAKSKISRKCVYCSVVFRGYGFDSYRNSDRLCRTKSGGNFHSNECAIEGCKHDIDGSWD